MKYEMTDGVIDCVIIGLAFAGDQAGRFLEIKPNLNGIGN